MSRPRPDRAHPGADALRAWLDADRPDPAVDDHVAVCDQCAELVEEIGDDPGALGAALRVVTEPPVDLRSRLERRLQAAALSRETTELLADLFGLGVRTARVLLDPDDPRRRDDP